MRSDGGAITGTPDAHYDLVWFTERCLNNALRLEQFIVDCRQAGDTEAEELFLKAQADSRKGAEMGKALLAKRLGA